MPKVITIFAIFYHYQYYIKIINAYYLKLKYKIKQFIESIYCNYKQIILKSK